MKSSRVRHAFDSQYGFSLVEIIIFIVVVMMGFTAMMKVSSNLLLSGGDSAVRVQAIEFADARMRQLMDMDFATLSAQPNNSAVQEAGMAYTSSIKLTQNPDYVQIDITTGKGAISVTLTAVKY